MASSLTVTDSQGDGLVIKNSPDLVFSSPVTNVSTATGAAADGIVLQNNSVDATKVNLGQVTVATTNGTGLIVQNAGVTTAGGTINATGGASIATNNADVNITLASATSTNSSGPGLDLTETSGSVNIGTTTVTSPTGNGINAVNNDPGFTADFGVTQVSGITNGAIGVNITNATDPNPDTVYSFDSLDVTTVNGTGLVAKNGGTINFNSPATITANSGAAIDLENTAGTTGGVAGSGFTFLDLTSIDSVANGVRLNNLRSNLTVTGVTKISGAAGPSILITDTVPLPTIVTDSILFNAVNITNRENIGVRVDGIFGQVQFVNLNIDNANNVAGDAVFVTNTTNLADPTGTGSGRVYIAGGTISNRCSALAAIARAPRSRAQRSQASSAKASWRWRERTRPRLSRWATPRLRAPRASTDSGSKPRAVGSSTARSTVRLSTCRRIRSMRSCLTPEAQSCSTLATISVPPVVRRPLARSCSTTAAAAHSRSNRRRPAT